MFFQDVIRPGLPAPHFAYVKKISHGLPLFLFNYSDWKLQDVFEAAGHGQLNIEERCFNAGHGQLNIEERCFNVDRETNGTRRKNYDFLEKELSHEAMAWRTPSVSMVRQSTTTNPAFQAEGGDNLAGTSRENSNSVPAPVIHPAAYDPKDRTDPLHLHPNESPSRDCTT
nr:ring canal kelch homolog isoform X1 [Ipomoea batatas]